MRCVWTCVAVLILNLVPEITDGLSLVSYVLEGIFINNCCRYIYMYIIIIQFYVDIYQY